MKVDYEIPTSEESFTTVEVDVADVLTLAMTQDPRLLAALITELMWRESVTLRTMLSSRQKKDLLDAVEVISHG